MTDRYFIKLSPNGETERIYDIGSNYTLKTLQGAVGGDVETVGTTLGLAVKMVINRDGKLEDLPVNKPATELAVIRSYDYIAGDAVFALEHGDELIGFTESDAEMIEKCVCINETPKKERINERI
jgi:hypothetical protein